MHKVSVIIPTYKRAEKLERAIESVLNQTYHNIEVIIVDDNNPDTEYRKITEEIMQKYINNPKVIYIKHEKNKNGAAARNTGIRHSQGLYIAFLDDDDYYLSEKIEKQVNFLEANNEYDGVYCGKKRKGKDIIPKYSGDLTIKYLKAEISIGTPTLLIKKEAILRLNGFDETFNRHQDVEFLLRYFEHYKLGYVEDVLLVIGDNEGENILKGKKLDELKKKFFKTFSSKINELNEKNKGLKKDIYSNHYSTAFLSHLRNGYILRAIKIYIWFLFYCPIMFHKKMRNRIKAYNEYLRYKKS
ncbi:MAG: glycosyltransferase family 2 protein [Christensenellales bacterium]